MRFVCHYILFHRDLLYFFLIIIFCFPFFCYFSPSSSVPNNTSKSSDASSSRYESNDITVSEGHSSFSTVPIVSDLTSSKTTSTGIVSSSIASEAIPTPLSVPLIQVVVPTAIASRVTHASLVRSSMASTSSSSSSVVCDENAKKNR